MVGALFFGVAGAIIGAASEPSSKAICTSLQLIVHINSFETPQIVIDYVKNGNLSKSSSKYKTMKSNLQEVCSLFEVILKNNNSITHTEEKTSNKEQLKELKEMLEEGLITQKEFEAKKKQILGL